MCRHAAYIGPGISATELVRDLDHSLLRQSYMARELLVGTVCADGYGFSWYDDDRPEAARYASATPIWADPNLDTMAPSIRSRIVLGAVRNATIASANSPDDAAPFVAGRHTWSLNGFVDDFPGHWRDGPMRDWISSRRRAGMRGRTDGEHLFAAWLSRLDEEPAGSGAAVQAMQRVVRDTLHEADAHGFTAQLNIIASDGQHLFAVRAGNRPTQNSLYVLHDGREFPDAWVVASEPLYDDPLWEPVPPDSILALSADAPPVRLKA